MQPDGLHLPPRLFGATVVVGDVVADAAPAGPETDGLEEVRFGPARSTCRIWVGPHRAVVHHDGIGRFEVRGGTSVVFQPVADVEPRRAAAALHSSVPSVVLAQQGRFALHASTVSIDGVGVAVAGRSGVGKSTTALALVTRGAAPVVDDVTVLDPGADGRMVASAFGRSVRAFPAVLDALGIETPGVIGADGKAELPWPIEASVEVRTVVVLRTAPTTGLDVRRLGRLDAVQALDAVTHLGRLAATTAPDALLEWHVAVARSADVVLVRRPAEGCPVFAVCDAIAAAVAGTP